MSDKFSGTCKWFNTNKGYGFIVPDNGGKDVFIHIRALEKTGLRSLQEGQRVRYRLQQDRGRESACEIEIVN